MDQVQKKKVARNGEVVKVTQEIILAFGNLKNQSFKAILPIKPIPRLKPSSKLKAIPKKD